MTLSIAALASGAGSNVRSILAAIASGKLDARMVLLLSNNPEAGALDVARAADVPVRCYDHRAYPDRESFDRAMLDAIRESGADTVVLAGYMRLLSPFFVKAFEGRMLNIHPAVLPGFPGMRSAGQAVDYGVRFSGATVHFVNEEMDGGPVIIQAVVPLAFDDGVEALMERIHAMEHRIYPQALQWLAEDRLRIHGRKVELLPGPGVCRVRVHPRGRAGTDNGWSARGWKFFKAMQPETVIRPVLPQNRPGRRLHCSA